MDLCVQKWNIGINMELGLSKVTFSPAEEQHYKPEFENLAKGDSGAACICIEDMRVFLKKLRLSDHDIQKVLSLVLESSKVIFLHNFMAIMRLCSMIKQGRKYSKQDIAKEQKILARRSKPTLLPPVILQELPENAAASSKIYTKITVEPPVLISSGWFGAKSYFSYRINCVHMSQSYSVIRRFSDLDWLHCTFVNNYKGFIVPPLPDKAFINNTDKAFIDIRRSEMERLLNYMYSHNVLCESHALIAFLTYPEKEFTEFKTSSEDSHECFEIKGIEDVIDKTIVAFKTKLKCITSPVMASTNSKIQEITEINSKALLNYQALILGFQLWTGAQCTENGLILEILESMNERTVQVLHERRGENIKILKNYEEAINEEYLRSQGLSQAVKLYEESGSQLGAHKTLLERKLVKHRTCTDPKNSARYIVDIQLLQVKIEELTANIDKIEQNIALEFTDLQKIKTERLSETIDRLILTQVTHYRAVLDCWSQVQNISK